MVKDEVHFWNAEEESARQFNAGTTVFSWRKSYLVIFLKKEVNNYIQEFLKISQLKAK